MAARRGLGGLDESSRNETWKTLAAESRRLAGLVADLALIQTQVRVQLIELPRADIEENVAVSFAKANRLDLMNSQARVVDAWRGIRVAADALEADVDIVVNTDLATDPFGANPVDFSSSASNYRVGVRVDAPLNRRAERNVYRRELIAYQEARRAYIALTDRVVQAVRRDLRQLESDRVSFEIARQSLVVAARQVEEARAQLLEPGRPTDSSNTGDVLNALNSLLQTRNDLITSWVNYETSRILLLLDMEALERDPTGEWINILEAGARGPQGASEDACRGEGNDAAPAESLEELPAVPAS